MNLFFATDDTFKEVGLKGLFLLDFYADWCGPCKMMLPILEQIAEEQEDFKIIKIDADSNPMLVDFFDIKNIPTLMFIRDGEILGAKVGFIPKPKVYEWFNQIKEVA